MEKLTKYQYTFSKFVPECFSFLLAELLVESGVHFKIVKGRKTKWGDFRPRNLNGKPQITVNGDLNPYSFLITTLHEFAHLQTFEQFRNRVLPHGEEWKATYRQLLVPAINSGKLPKDIEHALVRSLSNTKASSCTDHGLSRVLKSYDRPKEGVVLLEQLPKNTTFELNGRQFVKGPLRRKRFVCQEVYSDRSYLVNALAEVRPIK